MIRNDPIPTEVISGENIATAEGKISFQGEESGRLFSLVSETELQIWAAYDGDTPIYIPMCKP